MPNIWGFPNIGLPTNHHPPFHWIFPYKPSILGLLGIPHPHFFGSQGPQPGARPSCWIPAVGRPSSYPLMRSWRCLPVGPPNSWMVKGKSHENLDDCWRYPHGLDTSDSINRLFKWLSRLRNMQRYYEIFVDYIWFHMILHTNKNISVHGPIKPFCFVDVYGYD